MTTLRALRERFKTPRPIEPSPPEPHPDKLDTSHLRLYSVGGETSHWMARRPGFVIWRSLCLRFVGSSSAEGLDTESRPPELCYRGNVSCRDCDAALYVLQMQALEKAVK